MTLSRKYIFLNLFDIDIRDLIHLNEVENSFSLGPNSSFLYCFDFLYKNIEWLLEKFRANKEKYFIIDTPGQIEIFTQSQSFKEIIKKLTNHKEFDMRLCVVNLIESSNVLDLSRYVFSILNVLNAMIFLELPQINIISKIDLLKDYDQTSMNFPLCFYKNPNDSDMLKQAIEESNVNPKFKKLNTLLCDFVIEYGLVSFDTLNVQNQKQLNKIAALVDKANGYIYMDTGSLKEEKYIEIRNHIARNDLDFENEDEGEDDMDHK
jgi:hypothetical protein